MGDPDLQIGGRSSRPWDERGRAVSKEIFRPFGPHFGLKLRRGAGPQSLSPGSATGYGIEGSLLQWFRNFFTNRQQRVVVRGTTSLSSVKSGVSQGTILGPILKMERWNENKALENATKRLLSNHAFIWRGKFGKRSLSHQLCVDIMFIKTYGNHRSGKSLLLNESLTTQWTNTPWK